jgi:hypothetical protein
MMIRSDLAHGIAAVVMAGDDALHVAELDGRGMIRKQAVIKIVLALVGELERYFSLHELVIQLAPAAGGRNGDRVIRAGVVFRGDAGRSVDIQRASVIRLEGDPLRGAHILIMLDQHISAAELDRARIRVRSHRGTREDEEPQGD